DQQADLIAAFASKPNDPMGASSVVLVCRVDASGVPVSCEDIIGLVPELTGITGLACVDATPANAAPRGRGRFDRPPTEDSQNLMVLCHPPGAFGVRSQVFRVFHDEGGYHGVSVFEHFGSLEKLEVGDINGDGLDDLLALELSETSPFPSLLSITQCASKDVGLCAGTETQ
ncbi:MAG: hypothetical protein ABI175_09620, partial [Polyangiales bacterium]